jgi:hypothetical protein
MNDDKNRSREDGDHKTRKRRLPLAKVLIVVAFAGLISLSGYLYLQLQDVKNNPDKVSQAQVNSLVKKVGRLIALPTDEQPTVATVQDKEKLKDQPFFNGAENDDKLLIYTKAQKAIIYRESTNSLINVGPVTLDTQQAAQQTPNQGN